ncbi:MAG: LysR family transcriptional regulator [Verrucomicrobiota bacterium]|nr:LysR family transcriptional regulator [Verrucomicrobiota bacterium]
MQVETFKIFCDLADTGSFSKAATLNSITQSAVSQQIRALETRFHVTLIERGRRNFALTQEGREFHLASKQIVEIYGQLGHRLLEMQNVVAGELRVATIYTIGLHELPDYVKTFRELFPRVNVRVEYRRTAQVYQAVANGEVDIGLVSFPAKRYGLEVEPFLKDRLVLICHPSHPLAKKKSIRLEELNGEKFISFQPDLPTRKVIDRHFKEHSVAIVRTIEFDNIETVKRAVEVETGVSIVPENTVRLEVKNGDLAAVQISAPEMWRPLGILLKRNRTRSPAVREFISLLQKDSLGD